MMTWEKLFDRLHHGSSSDSLALARRLGARSVAPAVGVSACLVGVRCRYDGGLREVPGLVRALHGHEIIPLCPEVLAGLGVPRPTMVFVGGDGEAALDGRARLVDEDGQDRTMDLALGAGRALRLALEAACESLVLKARSPSCGVRWVHTREGLVAGRGMFTGLALRAGLEARTDEELLPRS